MKTAMPDDHIHFGEHFRRARRNVLFWASITLLTAAGTLFGAELCAPYIADTNVSLGSLTQNLSFPPGWLTFALMSVTLFALAGYARAETRHLLENTIFLRRARESDLETVALELSKNFRELLAKVEKNEEWRGQITASLQQFEDPKWLRSQLDHAGRDELIDLHTEVGEAPELEDWRDATDAQRIQFERETSDWYRGLKPKVRGALADGQAELVRIFIKTLKAELSHLQQGAPDFAQEPAELAAEVKAATAEISTFSRAFDLGEKRWFWVEDRLPTVGLAIFAITIAACRIVQPAELAASMQYWSDCPAQSSNPGTGASGSTEPTP